MSGFIRRFLFDPGNEVLLEIESINILDLEPPASIQGIGTGTVMLVGEFENGPFNTPTEVSSSTDLKNVFGTHGYAYGGVIANNPCAVKRRADAALVDEYWNGNSIVQLNGKKFKRLVLVRADTSTGSVTFTRCAMLTGIAAWRYVLDSGQTLIVDSGAGDVTATFTAIVAAVTGSGGTYPTVFAGGETLTLYWDDQPQFTTTFLSSDQTATQVAARINQYAGWTFATVSGGELRLTARIKGNASTVGVVSGSTGVLTKLGLSAAVTHPAPGTCNVQNIAAVSVSEAHTVCVAADPNLKVTTDSQSRIRMINIGIPGTGTLKVKSTSTAIAFGFAPLDVVVSAATGDAGMLSAGTRVRNSGGTEWVTMQDVSITAASAGPYTMKVRPALDDGTNVGAVAGTITTVYDAPDIGAFACINYAPLVAALSEAAIDATYTTAYASTVDLNSVAKEVNISFCARQSNTVRRMVKSNAIDASANGCFGRFACVRAPLGITRSTARSTAAEPGVGAYRDQRVAYCYPGVNTTVPSIATRGTAGGAGFTATGAVDVGADGFLASLMSQLPPEENPGQETPFLTAINSVETSPNAQGFTIIDYTNFRSSGICAIRIDGGTAFFQSGVTSVDPAVYPNYRNIARRRYADMVQDTMALRLKGFSKKLATAMRRKAVKGEIVAYMDTLKNRQNSYSLSDSSNTPTELAMGLYRLVLKIRTLSSLDSITLETMIGESVITTTETV